LHQLRIIKTHLILDRALRATLIVPNGSFDFGQQILKKDHTLCDRVHYSDVASGSEWRWAFLSSQHPNRLCLSCNSLLTSLCCSFALAKNSLASTTEWAKGFTYFPKTCWQEMAEQKRQSSKKCLTVGFSQHKFRRTSSPIIFFTLTTWLRFVYRNYPKRAEGTCISD